ASLGVSAAGPGSRRIGPAASPVPVEAGILLPGQLLRGLLFPLGERALAELDAQLLPNSPRHRRGHLVKRDLAPQRLPKRGGLGGKGRLGPGPRRLVRKLETGEKGTGIQGQGDGSVLKQDPETPHLGAAHQLLAAGGELVPRRRVEARRRKATAARGVRPLPTLGQPCLKAQRGETARQAPTDGAVRLRDALRDDPAG